MGYRCFYYLKYIIFFIVVCAVAVIGYSSKLYGGFTYSIAFLGMLWIVYFISRKMSHVEETIEWKKRARNKWKKRIRVFFEWENSLTNVPIIRYIILVSMIYIAYGIFCFYQNLKYISQYGETAYYGHQVIEIILFVIWFCVVLLLIWSIGRKEDLIKFVSRKKWNPFIYSGVRRRLADRFVCDACSPEELDLRVAQISEKENYNFWKYYEWNTEEYANVYIREYDDKVALDIIELIRIPEMKDEHIEMLQEHYKIMLEDYFKDLGTDTDLTYIYVLCVDKITLPFRELIDQLIVERRFKYYLPIGVCFSEKEVYIPLMAGRADLGEYLNLRSKALKLLYSEMK